MGPWLIDEVIPSLEWGLGSKLAEAVRAQDAKRLEEIANAKAKDKVKSEAKRGKADKPARASGKKTSGVGKPVEAKAAEAEIFVAPGVLGEELDIIAAALDGLMTGSKGSRAKSGKTNARKKTAKVSPSQAADTAREATAGATGPTP